MNTHHGTVALLLIGVSGLTGCNESAVEPTDDAKAEATSDKRQRKNKPEKVKPKEEIASADPQPKLPAPVIMGAAGQHQNLTISVTDIKDVAPTPKSEQPQQGQKLIAVSVTAAVESGSAMVAGAMFDIVADDGQRFRSSILPCTETPLTAGNAAPNAAIQGDLCFVVPKDGKLMLMLKSGGKDVLPFKLGF